MANDVRDEVTLALRVQSLDRALRLLEALQPGARTVADLCGEVQLPRSTVFRLLKDLESRGYVQRRAPGSFALSLKVLQLAGALLDQLEVREACRPVLAQVAFKTGRTCHVSVRDGLYATCIECVEAEQPLRLTVSIGRRTPLHAGAGSRVLLAYAPDEVLRKVMSGPLLKLSRNTATTPSVLGERLAKVRADGFCVSYSEAFEGVHGVAAPIRDQTTAVVAAISIGGVQPPTNRDERKIVRQALEAAAMISARLGHIPQKRRKGN
jgi:IclR family transcriptional regulator, KDG regulon repressor